MTRYYNTITYTDDELYHHGIKGMKWGVRRYQNKDGTYTNVGKRRRIKDIRKVQNKRAKSTDINQMSTKELDDLNHRIQSENTYINHISSQGGNEVTKTLRISGNKILGAVATGVGIYTAQRIVSKVINENAGAMIRMPKK